VPRGSSRPTHASAGAIDSSALNVTGVYREREIFTDNLLVRVHWIIEMIVVERPCAMGGLISTFPVYRDRGTSPIRKRPPLWDPPKTLGIGYGRVLGACVSL